jgi:hypothetical protein
MGNILFAARDPGAANVVAVFASRWRAAGHQHGLEVWSLPRATPVFERHGLASLEFPDWDEADLQQRWRRRPPDAVVTGTSHYQPFEPTLWRLAARQGIPSLAILDSWVNLAMRFSQGRPDFVGAVDTGQVADLARLGFSTDRVLLAGHPFLRDLLRSRSQRAPVEPRAASASVRLLFVSEPIAQDVAAGRNPPFGFDQIDVFQLLDQAATIAADVDRRVTIGVRLHPYEDPARLLARMRERPPHPHVEVRVIAQQEPAHHSLEWADLVTGIGSMLLLEAIAFGRPVLSVQPGLIREDTFIASERGFVDKLLDRDSAVDTLADHLRRPERREATRSKNAGFLDTLDPSDGAAVADWLAEKTHGRVASH